MSNLEGNDFVTSELLHYRNKSPLGPAERDKRRTIPEKIHEMKTPHYAGPSFVEIYRKFTSFRARSKMLSLCIGIHPQPGGQMGELFLSREKVLIFFPQLVHLVISWPLIHEWLEMHREEKCPEKRPSDHSAQ